MALDAEFISGISKIIDELGSIHTLKAAGVTNIVRGVVSRVEDRNAQLVNSVSIESKIFYCMPLAVKPKKFDQLTDSQGTNYVIKDVHDLIVSGAIVCHQIGLKT